MSAAANTLAGSAAKTKHKRVSGWAQLTRLYPYVRRHRGEVILGMLTQIGMGITGTLLPLMIGAIVDCIKGAEAPLAQLGRLTQISLGFLLPLLPSQGRPHARYILFGAHHRLHDPGILFVRDASDSDRAVARHRIRSAKRPASTNSC